LLPFPTSYLSESRVSVIAATKTKPRNRLDVKDTFAGVIEFHNS